MGGSTPVRVEELSNVIAVAAGRSHYVVLLSDGTVWAWGDNSRGQIGNNTVTTLGIMGRVHNETQATPIKSRFCSKTSLHKESGYFVST